MTPVSSSASPARRSPPSRRRGSRRRRSRSPAGRRIPGAAIPRPFADARPSRGDPPVDDLDVALHEARRRRAPPGRRASRVLARRPGRPRPPRPAARGRSASTPARSETIATFAFPSAAASASSTRSGGSPVACPTMLRDAGAQLVVRGVDVDHQVPVRLAEPDHRDRREHVQDELLGGAGLQPGRAGEDLGADRRRTIDAVGERGQLRARRRRRCSRVSAPAARAASIAPST